MNILFLVHRAPHPPDKGDRIRSFHLLKHLAGIGRVHLAAFSDEPASNDSRRVMESIADRIEIVPLGRSHWVSAARSLVAGRSATEGLFASRRLRETLQRWTAGTRFDVGIAFCSSMAPYLEALSLPRKYVDLVDVDSEKFLQYAERAAIPKRFLYALEARRLRALERRIGAWADCVALTTEAEADLYRALAPGSNVATVPNGVDLEYFNAAGMDPEPETCVFVGALDYRANVEGVVWFAEDVWPEVRGRRPEARLRIVGRRPTKAVQTLATMPGIEIAADVPDVRPYVRRSGVSIAPLRVARGVQNKVLEAMALGRPVLASPEAATGLGVADGRELLLARHPSEWVDRLLKLWDDADLRGRIADAGRGFVEKHHRWDACLAPWSSWLTAPRADLVAARPWTAVRARG